MMRMWKHGMIRLLKLFTLGAVFLSWSGHALADWQLNMPRGVTPISHEIYQLHMTVFWICVGIGTVVFGVLIYSLIMHRKSRGAVAADFHEHPVLEIVWAVIPFVILVIMAIPATRVLMMMEDTSEAAITIKVIGYQWKWEYEYLEDNVRFYSNLSTPIEQIHNHQTKNPWYLLEVDKPVVVPVNKKIRFLVTANDVIHSWWVPQLGIKRDGIPGFIHESWALIEEEGTYRGQCAELCGVNHGYMPIVVKAVSEEAYEAWLEEQRSAEKARAASSNREWAFDELMELGEEIYKTKCSVCHKLDGTGMPPVFPALKASSICVGKDINAHIRLVLNGVPGSAMLSFAKELTDAELAAVVTYERNAFGNKSGDTVQPSAVKALKPKTASDKEQE